ncbi:hypothetical protein F3Y22_tig00111022pilonHSYRG00027 [Hibiscus syriacus]|uniref:Pentatricopeptide repeat-containing protein n=1 Tax=Hibiscus syriacus TaxID=106335 RepID=A0A6A2Z6P3_HIBSY|nr:hypothetical protein F3Y22_tig00111022pilonHSYRG00027 [Hibiscus syriacus]
MEEMHLTPGRRVYNVLIHLYAEHVNVKNAFSLHHEMVDRGICPDKMTYNSMIMGQFNKGNLLEIKDLIGDIKAKGLVPKADTYELLIKGYFEHKDFIGAYLWYREMFENCFLPRFSTCKELVIGLRGKGKLQEAQIICSKMKAKGTDNWRSDEDLLAAANICNKKLLYSNVNLKEVNYVPFNSAAFPDRFAPPIPFPINAWGKEIFEVMVLFTWTELRCLPFSKAFNDKGCLGLRIEFTSKSATLPFAGGAPPPGIGLSLGWPTKNSKWPPVPPATTAD